MASRLLDRLKRTLFKDAHWTVTEQEGGDAQEVEEFDEDRLEAELAEEEECVTDRLGGTLSFDSAGGGVEESGEGEGLDSDSDFLGESMEEGLSSTDASPAGPSPPAALTQSWRNLCRLEGGSPAPSGRRLMDNLLFEVTDATVMQDGSSKYVLYTVHVVQTGGSDKTPAVITRRYSDFQRLHATLRRSHSDLMERVCFPRKKLRRNFAAETIARRSRAFEQYLSHLCSLPALRGALCVRQFFYLSDLQTGQVLIRVGRYQEALGPLLNAKRLQQKLGWASDDDVQAQAPPPVSSHWFFTLVGLSCCFQEVDQLEEAGDHCDHALRVLTPDDTQSDSQDKPIPHAVAPRPPMDRPHPLLLPLLRAVVRLLWQTGRDKRQWEELLQQLEGGWAGLDNEPTLKEFLVKHDLQESDSGGGLA